MPLRTHFDLDLHRWNRGHEVAHAHQIVSSAGKGEEPVDLAQSAMAQFAHQSHGLQPAKAFLDPFSLPLTEGVSKMSCRASINGTAAAPPVILGYVRHHAQGSALGYEPEADFGVEVFDPAEVVQVVRKILGDED